MIPETATGRVIQPGGRTTSPMRLLMHLDEKSARTGNFTYRMVGWMIRSQMLRQFEDESMMEGDVAPDDLAVHRQLLSTLIGYGELLVDEARENGVAAVISNGIGLEALEANLAMLHEKYACWHVPMTESESNQLITGVFGAGA